MNNLQGNIQKNNPDSNYTSSLQYNGTVNSSTGKQYQSEGHSNMQSHQGAIRGMQKGSASGTSQLGMINTDNYLKSTGLNNNNSNFGNIGGKGPNMIVGSSGGGQIRRDSNSGAMGYGATQVKHQQLPSQSNSMKEDDTYHQSNIQHRQHHLSMSNSHQQQQQQQSQGQRNMDIEKPLNDTSSQQQHQQNSNLTSTNYSSTGVVSGSGSQQQQEVSQNSDNQSSNNPSSATSNKTPAISRIDAQDVIINFKKHLLDKWKKNKAKQHVNKIIHYHVQHTFFLRYAAPLFLKDYQELLNQNLASAGQNNNNREQGLLSTLKHINQDILNGSKKTKSVDVLQSYLTKLEDKDQLNQFLDVLVFILFGEIPYQIPLELNERKKNLFHYVSPIIAFLIIFYIHSEKKPVTLDELVTRSGLKQLYKNIKVPCKDSDMDDPNGANANDTDEDEDDEMIDEDGESMQQNSGPQTQSNLQSTASKQLPPNTSQQLSSQQKNQSGNSGGQPSLKKKNSSHPNNNDNIKDEDDEGTSNYDEKSQSGIRNTPQFQDLEKTLMQQKQQLSQQVHSSQSSQQNIYNAQGSNSNIGNINIQKKHNMSNVNGNVIPGQQQLQSSGMMHSQSHHHHHHLHSNSNSMGNKGLNSSYQSQQSKQLGSSQQNYFNKQNINPDNDEYDEDMTHHDLSTNHSTFHNQNTPPSNQSSYHQNSSSLPYNTVDTQKQYKQHIPSNTGSLHNISNSRPPSSHHPLNYSGQIHNSNINQGNQQISHQQYQQQQQLKNKYSQYGNPEQSHHERLPSQQQAINQQRNTQNSSQNYNQQIQDLNIWRSQKMYQGPNQIGNQMQGGNFPSTSTHGPQMNNSQNPQHPHQYQNYPNINNQNMNQSSQQPQQNQQYRRQ